MILMWFSREISCDPGRESSEKKCLGTCWVFLKQERWFHSFGPWQKHLI